jgi:hypothetical protein
MSSYLDTVSNAVVAFRIHPEGNPVVIHREIGSGAVFMIGAGFYVMELRSIRF